MKNRDKPRLIEPQQICPMISTGSLAIKRGLSPIVSQIYSDLHRNIQDVFNEYKVAIMTPHYTGDTEDQKLVPKEQWYASPAKPPPSDTAG